MMIEDPWGQNSEDYRMMVEEPPREPPLIKYEKPRKYKPKFKKVYRIKLPPIEDRMLIEKEPSQKMQNPKSRRSRTVLDSGGSTLESKNGKYLSRFMCRKIC
jgi:hypothetical protein